MRIEPVIQGVVARTAHPLGCEQAVLQQIEYVKSAKPITQGPKRVLILGASSGFGLAARIALTFGGAKADTIGVSFERGPSDKGVGSAGYFNNLAFKKQADREGRIAININGDVFSKQVREQVIEAIETYFEGEVDLVIYSIASGMRRKPGSEDFWRSAIKPIGEPVSGAAILLENDKWVDATLEPANEEEIDSTLRVMGGEDWEDWIDTLINTESVAQGCKTIAFSYVGPEITHLSTWTVRSAGRKSICTKPAIRSILNWRILTAVPTRPCVKPRDQSQRIYSRSQPLPACFVSSHERERYARRLCRADASFVQ